jgi:hypothetical protein
VIREPCLLTARLRVSMTYRVLDHKETISGYYVQLNIYMSVQNKSLSLNENGALTRHRVAQLYEMTKFFR